MSKQFELDPADYHLRLLIERMERDGRSEAAIEKAVRIASGCDGTNVTTYHRVSARGKLSRALAEILA